MPPSWHSRRGATRQWSVQLILVLSMGMRCFVYNANALSSLVPPLYRACALTNAKLGTAKNKQNKKWMSSQVLVARRRELLLRPRVEIGAAGLRGQRRGRDHDAHSHHGHRHDGVLGAAVHVLGRGCRRAEERKAKMDPLLRQRQGTTISYCVHGTVCMCVRGRRTI